MSTSPLSSSNMQYLIQQSTAATQSSSAAKAKANPNQESFAASLGSATATGAGSLSDVTLASLTNGMSSTAAVDTASANVSSLLNIIV